MQLIEHIGIASAEEKDAIRQLIKDTRSQHYLYFVIGLGLPLVFWLLFFLKLEDMPDFIRLLFHIVLYWLPPVICGIALILDERENYFLKQASEKGIAHFSGAVVEKINFPCLQGAGFKHLNSYSVRIGKKWYYVDHKTCEHLSPGDIVKMRCIPNTGTVFELKKQADDDRYKYESLFKLRLTAYKS